MEHNITVENTSIHCDVKLHIASPLLSPHPSPSLSPEVLNSDALRWHFAASLDPQKLLSSMTSLVPRLGSMPVAAIWIQIAIQISCLKLETHFLGILGKSVKIKLPSS